MKIVIFCKNGFVHSGHIKHVGEDMLILDEAVKKKLITVKFNDINEIKEDGRY